MPGLRIGHADRVLSAITTDAPARSAVAASWRRSCATHGLDPAERRPPRQLSGSELRLARERIEPLLHAAQRSLDRLFAAIGGSGCCVLLADADGVPLERRGAVRDDAYFRGCGLWTGSVWSEGTEGTNGIGTCLVEHRPVTIHRDQHFLARNTALSCTGAPVFDHEANLAGVLDVSSCRDVGDGLLQLMALAVGDATRRIEAENFRAAFPQARLVMAPTTDGTNPGWLAVDGDDLVIGASRAARVALGITPARLEEPLPAADLLRDAHGEGLGSAERAVLARALARTGGNVTAAAAALGISRATLHRKLKREPGLRH
jgi:transcriptional regulator of acetoin/glycerol metabolism